ncbi:MULTISPECIES: VTT domain-containing protein [unclassified Paenibacillus]|uniref:YqaA family protein n=1 Tax=unclassified Paenibacillus TaxID=185978 RepID=UPI001AE85B88|nr:MULTISPECIES: VTT domain-containing protein [unclassified Paenibacillus]MBP1154281.1 membrane protein YqaA with SNARE-associated domain [Paenibacillus sp. PvP091]MBP1170334.1 membrane protein YqaA with SNARE-associated domain [Paenibacillus sp. PvR098]MBP2441362.1 membrane protein YqaA with SNARE-associated domain [Paenibacillus sp. PvP052]
MFREVIDFLKEFGVWGLFIHSFLDAIIFPIPAFFLQVPLSAVHPSSALWFATVGFIASLLGTPLGYLIGKYIGSSMLDKLLKKDLMDKATNMLQKNGEMAILIGAFTPIPFKVFTIMAGCLNFSIWKLLAYAALGRAAKFYAVGILFYLYGRTAVHMLDHLNYVFLGIGLLLAIVFVVIKRRKLKKIKQTE